MECSTTKYIIIWMKSSEIMKLAKDSGKQGAKKRKHTFLVHFFGGCAAHAHGCPTSFYAGYEEDQLLMVASSGSLEN